MKNIRLRAWDERKSKLSGPFSAYSNPFFYDHKDSYIMELCDVPSEHLKLYTERIDKNGVEICEGDIVQGIERVQVTHENSRIIRSEVFYHLGSFKIWDKALSDFWDHQQSKRFETQWLIKKRFPNNSEVGMEIVDVEVIGNIFQNIELLDEQLIRLENEKNKMLDSLSHLKPTT